jgi:hypothetical protein
MQPGSKVTHCVRADRVLAPAGWPAGGHASPFVALGAVWRRGAVERGGRVGLAPRNAPAQGQLI